MTREEREAALDDVRAPDDALGFDAMLEQIRQTCRIIGAERCEITVRQDGRVYIELADEATGYPRRGIRRAVADLEPDSAHGTPSQALAAMVRKWCERGGR